MHSSPQAVSPGKQSHNPFAQISATTHAVPQAPQFAASMLRSTHRPSQLTKPAGHAQAPSAQL
jgi:hypothetical protein